MCGIAGVLYPPEGFDSSNLKKMGISIEHRGPDDEGFYQNENIALCFRRLSILDLAHGRQPMTNEDRSVWVVFNGEIYNHLDLRKILVDKGYKFKTTHSDTEVFVHGWHEWGPDLFSKLNGMFACAIWDNRKRTLCLARDRYGIKPLYYSTVANGTTVFGSEVRAIHASGLVEKEPDDNGVLEYLSVQNNWRERTPFKNIKLVPNGSYIVFEGNKTTTCRYWNYFFNRTNSDNPSGIIQQHRQLLNNAVTSQIQADVPVRSYLSGGIDSSAITVLAHKYDPSITTYSCIFNLDKVEHDRHFDEREFSRSVASFIGASREEFEVSPYDLPKTLERVINALEYPMMGMSYVNYLIAERVAKDGKVVLSGMGGDEIHGGYLGRYQALPRDRNFLSQLSRRFQGNDYFNPGKDRHLDRYRAILNPLFNSKSKFQGLTDEFLNRAKDYSVEDEITSYFIDSPAEDYWDLIMSVDAKTYMHGLLVLEDKLSMTHSLETRVPLLDNNLVDYLLTLPWSILNDGKTGKIVFRESVKDLVPQSVYNKPKMGFGPPDASWYKNHLKDWIQTKLSPQKIRQRGVFREDFVKNVLDTHFEGRGNTIYWIWTLLCFETWCEINNFYGGKLT